MSKTLEATAETTALDPATPTTEPATPTLPSTLALSLRDRILAADDIPVETLVIPEWGVTVEVRGMSGHARAKMLNDSTNLATGEVDSERMYPHIVIACCVDPADNTPIFTNSDVDLLNQKSSAALERVAKVGMRLSGLGAEEDKEMGNDSSSESGGSTLN